jgi:hemolysin activation/secretion protein
MKKILLSFVLVLSPLAPLLAADPPVGANPAAQGQRYEEDVRLEEKELRKKGLKKPGVDIQEEEKPAVPEISFVLKNINITGAAAFKDKDLKPLYDPYLNKQVSQVEIDAVINKIKAAYARKGYLTVIVYLPEQDIKDGVLEIRVVEGKLGTLTVEGGRDFSPQLISKYIHLKKNEILNFKVLERDLLRLNQIPDLEVKAALTAGKEPQTSDLTLKVTDGRPWHFGLTGDSQGTRLSGRYRASVYLRSSNLTGNLDALFLNALYSGNSSGEALTYTLPLDTYGTRLSIEIVNFESKLGKEYKVQNISGTTQIYNPFLTFELLLNEVFQVNANLGLNIKSVQKKTNGSRTADDQLRMPYFEFDLSETDAYGSTDFTPQFIFSPPGFLGASKKNHPSGSRAGTGGFFFKYIQGFNRTQKMPWESYVSMRSQFQIPTHTLPSSEQIQVGGFNSVRGYAEGDYLADLGGFMRTDWFFPMYVIPKEWKLVDSATPLRNRIETIVFADVGGGKLKKTLSGEEHEKFLAGVGGGLRLRLYKKSVVMLEWAKYVGDKPASGNGPATFNFVFQAEY